jgi:hypothetical protein
MVRIVGLLQASRTEWRKPALWLIGLCIRVDMVVHVWGGSCRTWRRAARPTDLSMSPPNTGTVGAPAEMF